MELIRLGDVGPVVSRLGLGTGYFGTRVDAPTAARLVDQFLDAGGTLVDTADCYGRGVLRPGVGDAGAAERTLGGVLATRRDRVVLASKVGQRVLPGAGRDKVGLSATMIRRSVEASLRRLGTDRLDLYQCHLADPCTPVEETLEALTQLVSDGKVLHVGVSNWDGWQVMDARAVAARSDFVPVVSNQVWYNAADRRVENSVAPACHRVGVGIIAYSALAGGFLTGSYRRTAERPAPGGRLTADGALEHTSWEGLATEQGWNVVEHVLAVAEREGIRPSSVALRWLLENGAADVALVGPRSEAELAAILEYDAAAIPDDALRRLTELSEPDYSYPRSFTEAYARPDGPLYGGLPDLGYGAAR